MLKYTIVVTTWMISVSLYSVVDSAVRGQWDYVLFMSIYALFTLNIMRKILWNVLSD